MKVTTEACLFGAWVAENLPGDSRKALDIGAGTGLLSLMIAQESESAITAVEIDPEAAKQASENFDKSPWNKRLELIEQNITVISTRKKYDVIFSNPPFYKKNLASPRDSINLARHDTGISIAQLMETAKSLLAKDGIFYMLFPSSRLEEVMQLAANSDLYPKQQVSVKQSERHGIFREMIAFSFNPDPGISRETIIIRDGNDYSPRFIQLLQKYYLNL